VGIIFLLHPANSFHISISPARLTLSCKWPVTRIGLPPDNFGQLVLKSSTKNPSSTACCHEYRETISVSSKSHMLLSHPLSFVESHTRNNVLLFVLIPSVSNRD